MLFATVAVVMLRGEGCGESTLPPRRDGALPTGTRLDCEGGTLDLVMIPGEKLELPDCGLGAGMDAVAEGDLPKWASLDRDTETGRRQLRAGLDAPLGGPYALTLFLSSGAGGDGKRLKINVTIAVLTASLHLNRDTPGVREARAWSASRPAEYVVTADAPFDLWVDVRSLRNLDVVTWTVSSVSDPLDLRPYDGDLRRYFELPKGAWDVSVEVRDQERSTVTVSARVHAVPSGELGLVVWSPVAECPAEVLAALLAANGGPCDAVDTSAAPVCVRSELVGFAGDLDIRFAAGQAKVSGTGEDRAIRPFFAMESSQVQALCVGLGESVTLGRGYGVEGPNGAGSVPSTGDEEFVVAR